MGATLIRLVTVGALTVMLPFMGTAAPITGKGIHYLYLVRHGEYAHGRDDTEDERVMNGLTSLGDEQARLVGWRLESLPIKFDRLVSSELLRAKQTADDIGEILNMKPVRDSLLNKCEPTSDDSTRMADETPAELVACDSTRAQVWRRYFVPTPERDTYDLLVCNAYVIRWTLMKALGADTGHWPDQGAANAALTIFAVQPDASVRLVTYNDTGHIPLAEQTWSGRGGGWLKDE